MNKYRLIAILALSLNTSMSLAQSVGSAFSYQGELIDNGSPANGDYNFNVKLFTTETGGSAVTDEVYNDITVTNGLFNLEIDFGDMVYEDSEQYYLEFDVMLSAGGTLTTLAPRNKLLAVPYATQAQFLADGGGSWEGDDTFQYTPGKVTIGTSVSSERLYVQSSGSEDVFRARTPDGTKFLLQSNGGSSMGISFPAPENGLYVAGDVKQSEDSNGMLKYMFRANCDSTPSITREYNGTNVTGTASISGNTGQCTITLPINVTNNFISATPIQVNSSNRTISCANIGTSIICELTNASSGADVDGTFDVLVY